MPYICGMWLQECGCKYVGRTLREAKSALVLAAFVWGAFSGLFFFGVTFSVLSWVGVFFLNFPGC